MHEAHDFKQSVCIENLAFENSNEDTEVAGEQSER